MARQKIPFGTDRTPNTKALASVAAGFKNFRPAVEVVQKIQAVPTIFPQYNAMTGVGGHPISRLSIVHGPSNEGKTTFTLGLGCSFLERGHFFALIDAERSTPEEWLRELMRDKFDHPGFVALPSSSYEQTVDAVREFCDGVAEARIKNRIPEETTGIIVLDSLRKLVPKNLIGKLQKGSEKNGVDGIGGRAGQIKAALNAAWVDELVPLLADTKMAMTMIARETEDPNAGMFDDQFKVGGGKAVFYDSSLAIRIVRRYIPHPDEELAKTGSHVGERHTIEIRKTKVSQKRSKRPRGYFHTSNGAMPGSPLGFDFARDLFELGRELGVVEQKGSWYSLDGEKLGQGEVAVLKRLWGDAETLATLERSVMKALGKDGE